MEKFSTIFFISSPIATVFRFIYSAPSHCQIKWSTPLNLQCRYSDITCSVEGSFLNMNLYCTQQFIQAQKNQEQVLKIAILLLPKWSSSSNFSRAYLYSELKEIQIGIFQIKKCNFTTAFAKVGILVINEPQALQNIMNMHWKQPFRKWAVCYCYTTYHFKMQISTAEQVIFFVLPRVKFVLLWVKFVLLWISCVLPWVNFVLPWVNSVLPWANFVLPSDNTVLPWAKFVVPWLFVLLWQLWATVIMGYISYWQPWYTVYKLFSCGKSQEGILLA